VLVGVPIVIALVLVAFVVRMVLVQRFRRWWRGPT
jgi:hypothetical protein